MIGGHAATRLVGQRVALRPYSEGFDEAELRALYRWARDPELLRLTGGLPLDLSFARFREVFRDKLTRLDPTRELLYALLDEQGHLIGRIGLFALDPAAGSAELGIVLGERASWGRARGREAIGLLAGHAFGELKLSRILLHTYPENTRAQRAFAAAGFRETRRLRRFSLDRGTHDEIEMQLVPADLERVQSLAALLRWRESESRPDRDAAAGEG
ncbi:MAG: GNAT family N-acetyltransferase [Caldilineae bacterium]|nr:GNAT family N-acetyltransferase [Chloroflexota bacterium]MCB9175919.1 GNAT family N-acetyltransferase [Caldilineae bacterium]